MTIKHAFVSNFTNKACHAVLDLYIRETVEGSKQSENYLHFQFCMPYAYFWLMALNIYCISNFQSNFITCKNKSEYFMSLISSKIQWLFLRFPYQERENETFPRVLQTSLVERKSFSYDWVIKYSIKCLSLQIHN